MSGLYEVSEGFVHCEIPKAVRVGEKPGHCVRMTIDFFDRAVQLPDLDCIELLIKEIEELVIVPIAIRHEHEEDLGEKHLCLYFPDRSNPDQMNGVCQAIAEFVFDDMAANAAE